MVRRLTTLLLLFVFFSACGTVSYSTTDGNDDSLASSDSTSSQVDDDSRTYIFATDYASSGQLYTAYYLNGDTSLTNTGLTQLGSEASVRLFNNLLYILHAGASYTSVSSDNVQIVDPFDASSPYKTLGQFSTGNGTNPLDILVSGTRAFISLYEPTSDEDNVDASGNPGDVIEMDTDSGEITKRYSFNDYLEDDGDKNARAYQMLMIGNILYVLLQDLESNTFEATAPGLIGMINISTQTVLGVIELIGRNPSAIATNSDQSKLYVASTYDREYEGSYSGIDIIDVTTRENELFIPDDELGGYVERLKTSGAEIFAVVSKYDADNFTFESKIIAFDQDINSVSGVEQVHAFGTDIRDIFVEEDKLWVTYRVISTTEGDSSPNIKVFDTDSRGQIGETLYPSVAGVSIAGTP